MQSRAAAHRLPLQSEGHGWGSLTLRRVLGRPKEARYIYAHVLAGTITATRPPQHWGWPRITIQIESDDRDARVQPRCVICQYVPSYGKRSARALYRGTSVGVVEPEGRHAPGLIISSAPLRVLLQRSRCSLEAGSALRSSRIFSRSFWLSKWTVERRQRAVAGPCSFLGHPHKLA